MKVQGKRILVNKPYVKDHKSELGIELGEDTKAELEKAEMQKWLQLEVYAVGDECTKIEVGDKVYLPSFSLSNAEVIPIGDDLKFCVNESEVYIIW